LGSIATHPAEPDAIEYGRVLARRLFGDLEPADERTPLFAASSAAPLNQLLGAFNLLRNSRFRKLERPAPNLRTWTARLRGQVATAVAVGTVLADWPRQWHRALEQVADSASPPRGGRRRILSVEQARAPFVALQRVRWSAAAEFPSVFRAEMAKFLSGRTIRVGSRRYYAEGMRSDMKAASPTQLKHLWSWGAEGGSIGTEDLLSAEAVRDLFDATAVQMRALQSVGILPKDRRWFAAREVDAGFERLTRWTCSRPRATDEEFTPLWDLGVVDGSELEQELRRVITGETPTVTWRHIRPAGLGNLFVRSRSDAQAARAQREIEESA
jgi:hypothetical protein